jgi:Na+-translocating ferredoxin:NAD+ oxidoreductase RnfG subunit
VLVAVEPHLTHGVPAIPDSVNMVSAFMHKFTDENIQERQVTTQSIMIKFLLAPPTSQYLLVTCWKPKSKKQTENIKTKLCIKPMDNC